MWPSLVRRRSGGPKIVGSNPIIPTNNFNHLQYPSCKWFFISNLISNLLSIAFDSHFILRQENKVLCTINDLLADSGFDHLLSFFVIIKPPFEKTSFFLIDGKSFRLFSKFSPLSPTGFFH